MIGYGKNAYFLGILHLYFELLGLRFLLIALDLLLTFVDEVIGVVNYIVLLYAMFKNRNVVKKTLFSNNWLMVHDVGLCYSLTSLYCHMCLLLAMKSEIRYIKYICIRVIPNTTRVFMVHHARLRKERKKNRL